MLPLLLLLSLQHVLCEVQDVTESNYDDILAQNEIVFLYIYADWCRFTQSVTPHYEDFANKVSKEITQPGKVLIGKMNYERNHRKVEELSVNKFPTFKLYRFGQMAFGEYRGPRTVDDWYDYIMRQINIPMVTISAGQSPANLSEHDRFVVGRFPETETKAFSEFRKAASVLRDDCNFFIISDPTFGGVPQSEALFFGNRKNPTLITYQDVTENFLEKAKQFCVPLVRKLTFSNAEDFADIGRPLLVLFERPDESDELRLAFESTLLLPELRPYSDKFTYVYANGSLFVHALHSVGKSISNLPLIAIDSLRHMYVYNGQFGNSTQLKKFFDYFFDGTLHRLYHFGQLGNLILIQTGELPKEDTTKPSEEPPQSVIKLLGPSKYRYTFKDEL